MTFGIFLLMLVTLLAFGCLQIFNDLSEMGWLLAFLYWCWRLFWYLAVQIFNDLTFGILCWWLFWHFDVFANLSEILSSALMTVQVESTLPKFVLGKGKYITPSQRWSKCCQSWKLKNWKSYYHCHRQCHCRNCQSFYRIVLEYTQQCSVDMTHWVV